MIPLNEVLAFSTKLPGIYTELELTKLYELAVALPDHATVVEIGVLYGRSASVFFQVAQHKPLDLYFIDPWVVSEGDAYREFHTMVDQHFRKVPFTMYNMTSLGAAHTFRLFTIRSQFPRLSVGDRSKCEVLVHIDGDHSLEGISTDCRWWLDYVNIAVFHDYDARGVPGHDQADGGLAFPQIKEMVDRYCAGWEKVGVFDSQAIFRRTQ